MHYAIRLMIDVSMYAILTAMEINTTFLWALPQALFLKKQHP